MEPSTESSMSTSSLPADTVVLNESSDPAGLKSPTSTSPPDSGHATPALNPLSPPSEPAAAPQSLKPPLAPPPRKISAALLKASMASLTADEGPGFTSLSASLPLVLAQSSNGVESVRRMAEFVEKVVKAKAAYANALLSAVAEVNRALPAVPPTGGDKLGSPPPHPRKGSSPGGAAAVKPRAGSGAGVVSDGEIGARYQHAWQTLRDVVQAEGLSDSAASRAFHDTVSQPLLEYSRELAQKHAILKEHADSMEQQVRASQERLLQNKIAVLKLLEAQHVAEQREQHEREEKARQEAAGKSSSVELAKAGKSLKTGLAFLFKSKDKQMTEALHSLSSDELRQQAYEATVAYSQSVAAANARSDTYYDHDLPTVLRQLHMMEATRLETLRLHLELLSTHYKGVMDPAEQRVQSFTTAVTIMETKADLDDYVHTVTASMGGVAPTRPNAFVYDLAFTADDVRNNTVTLHPQPTEAADVPRLFGCSLVQVMEGQRGSHAGLDVPWIVPSLCEAIRQGGKPVFVFSVDSDEVMKGRRRLEEGDPLQSDEPEVAAAVLKMWLRDLEPHLVSGEHYTAALDAAKANDLSTDTVLRLFKALPDVNQRVLQHIASTMTDVSAKDPAGLDTVATVLAPHIMQNPAVDGAAVLGSINHEVAFVHALLQTVSTHHPVGREGNGVSGDLPKVEVVQLEDGPAHEEAQS